MASIAFPSLAKKATLSDGTVYGYVHNPPSNNEKPTFLLLHGYPSSSYDWRHQIKALSKSGFGVIAPDLLGYGDTDKPSNPSAYRQKTMAGHMVELLDIEKIDKAIAVGHDWGCGLLSRLPTYHADRFYGIVPISVSYLEPGLVWNIDQFIDLTEKLFGYATYGYWKWHDTEEAVTESDEHPASLFNLLYPADPELWKTDFGPPGKAKAFVSQGKRTPLPSWVSDEEFAIWEKILSNGGFRGPLNWYKAAIRGVNSADEKVIPQDERFCEIPTLLIVSEKDYITRADAQIPKSREWCKKLQVEMLDCGHWCQLEKPEKITKLLKRFAGEVV